MATNFPFHLINFVHELQALLLYIRG